MVQGILSVLPLLLLITLGFCIAKSDWFGVEGMNFLSRFTLNIAIPILIFYNVTEVYTHPEQLLQLVENMCYPFIITVTGMLVGLIMARALRIRKPQLGVFINSVSLTNTVVMGVPVASSLFGESAIPFVMIFYGSNTLVYWTFGVWLLRRDGGGGGGAGFAGTLKTVLKTRPLMAFIVAIAWVCTRLTLPQPVTKSLSMMASSVTPLAMIFIGSVIRFADLSRMGKSRVLLTVVAYRLFAVPVVTCFICGLLPVEPMMRKVFFIISNMPAMAQLPIMAKEVGSDYELASMVTAVTTAVSIFAIPVYVGLMEHFQLLN